MFASGLARESAEPAIDSCKHEKAGAGDQPGQNLIGKLCGAGHANTTTSNPAAIVEKLP
jgi:hypothetical protein